MKKYTFLTPRERIQLEAYLKVKKSPREISRLLNRHISTIYREIKRGEYQHLNGDTWITEKRYSSDKAQAYIEYGNSSKGVRPKLSNDYEFVRFVSEQIRKKNSPAVILATIRREGRAFRTRVSLRTLYNYIYLGYIPGISSRDLLLKGKRRKHRKTRRGKTLARGRSIHERPAEVLSRDTFGHWELDSVIGTSEKGTTVLSLVERKTRFLLTFRARNKSAVEPVRFLNFLERKLGTKNFRRVFRSITVDNGTEFSYTHALETSAFSKQPRTELFYCDPYSSWQRGTNENHNRFLRRYIPKGVPISRFSSAFIQQSTDEINDYPRALLQWQTPRELFESELSKMDLKNISNFFRTNY